MKALAIINQKGGVAKTTTTHAVGSYLAIKGKRVLLIDLDPQTSLTAVTGADRTQYNIMDVLLRRVKASEAVQATARADIITASEDLSDIETILKNTGREYRLKEVLQAVSGDYDYCVIDCPPSLNLLTINALTTAQACIITANADFLSCMAITQLHGTINTIRQYTNPELAVSGILITRYDNRPTLAREAVKQIEALAQQMDTIVFKTKIRNNIALAEAQIQQQSIFDYAPKSNGATDYTAFMSELSDRL